MVPKPGNGKCQHLPKPGISKKWKQKILEIKTIQIIKNFHVLVNVNIFSLYVLDIQCFNK